MDAPVTHVVVPPWRWAVLNFPFGATSGFVTVMLGFLLKQRGLGDAAIASLVALNLLPHTWKVLWAPIADSTLTRKRWYLLANMASCATILGLAFTPITAATLDVVEVLVFANALAITLVGMAVEGLMAHATPAEQRGRAAGWFQVGNVGGSGLGGGLGLYLAESLSTQVAFVVIAAVLSACTLALRGVPEAPRLATSPAGPGGSDPETTRVAASRALLRRMVEVFRELWQMLSSRRGLVAIALVFLPIGAAAAQNLFSGQLATEWGASADLVATTSGFAAGIAATVGCLCGGWLSDTMGRRRSYMASGLLLALIAAGMAAAPRNPATYAVFTLAYQFGGGIAYGTFTGFVLEVIGAGAAATKYNALASLSNIPITYMTKLEGWASDARGPGALLLLDAGSEIAGIVVFALVVLIVRPDRARPAQPETPGAA